MNNQKGFTLIELLVVVSIIGILAALAITSFSTYRSKAAYSTIQITMKNTRNAAEAGTVDPDSLPEPVALATQNSPGPIADADAANFLPGMQLPKNVKFQVSYDPACTVSGCVTSFAELKHCFGDEYIQWIKYGDGTDVMLEHIDGSGCS